jgi:hypothetical protein
MFAICSHQKFGAVRTSYVERQKTISADLRLADHGQHQKFGAGLFRPLLA